MLSKRKLLSTLQRIVTVLILVLMEYALEETVMSKSKGTNKSLNPCSNGICSRSYTVINSLQRWKLCLNPCSNGICSRRSIHEANKDRAFEVLILVLMEYALEDVFEA